MSFSEQAKKLEFKLKELEYTMTTINETVSLGSSADIAL